MFARCCFSLLITISVLTITHANQGDITYQQVRENLNKLHEKSKYLKNNNAPSLDLDTALKLAKLLDAENLLKELGSDDSVLNDFEDVSFDILTTGLQADVSPTEETSTQPQSSRDVSGPSGIQTDSTKTYSTALPAETTTVSNDNTASRGKVSTIVHDTTVHNQYSTESTTSSEISTNMVEQTTENKVEATTTETQQTTNAVPSFFVSPLCLNHTKAVIAGLIAREDWAVSMLDALGKPPAGLKTGNVVWQGDYEECLNVNAISNISKPAYTIKGKYCLALVPLGNGQINPLTLQPVGIYVSLCVPDVCSNDDTKDLLNSVVQRASNNSISVMSVECKETLQSYDTRAIIVLTVVGFFIALLVIATAYDVILIQLPKSKETNKGDIYQNGGTVWRTVLGKSNDAYTEDNDVRQNGTTSSDLKYKLSGETELPSFEERKTEDEPYRPGILGKLLLSFSIYTNGAKILSTHQGDRTLTAVNGIRFISMTWVILGHTYAFGLRAVGNLATFYPKIIKRYSFMAIINAEVSVDTFFALSGCLLTYLFLRQMKKEKGKINWFMFYFHRFWRLTPPYMLVMMVYLALFPYTGEGPLWPKNGAEVNYCEDSWWYNLLYINNFRTVANQCFAWAWYLANDMQFYWISPIILVPMYFSGIAGTVVFGVFLLGTSIAAGVVSMHYGLGVSTFGADFADYFEQYYVRPYCRMGPYLIGMYTGFILYKTKCKCNINKYVNLILWGVFGAAASAVLYGVYDDINGHPISTSVAALYNAVHKTVWGAAICWVIFACATGNGGFINTILSWKGMVPLSRLTYCAYLVHPIVMYYFYYTKKKLIFWDDLEIIYEFLGNMGLSYAAAFVTSLAFESPMMGLEKVVFRRGEKKPK